MSILATLLLMWLVTFVPRWIGLNLGGASLPPFWVNFMKFVPVSVIAALIVPDIAGSAEWPRRVIGALVGSLLIWRTRNLGLGIVVGFAAYWAARLAGL